MTRSEIKTRFRNENPEFTERSIQSTTLDAWCIQGNLDVSTRARIIVDEIEFTSIDDTFFYDLTEQNAKFYDIDEMPGGGVEYNGRRIDKTSMAELSLKRRKWRSRTAGTPKEWFRRGKNLWFEKPTDGDIDIRVYVVLLPDSFDDDNKTPFNELPYLEPFHYGIVKYLEWKAKGKIEKGQAEADARNQYIQFVNDTLELLGGGKWSSISFENREKRFGGRRR